MPKKLTVTRYRCSVCDETESTDREEVIECENTHREMVKIMRIGARVSWNKRCAEVGYWVNGVVVGFLRDGTPIVRDVSYHTVYSMPATKLHAGWSKYNDY